MDRMKYLSTVLASLASAVTLFGCAVPTSTDLASQRLPRGPAVGDQVLSPFYDWHGPLPRQPGVMLRTEPMPAQPEITHASLARRILYSSVDARWQSGVLPVSGTLYLPDGPMPPGGWPLVAWAHGTLGVADACAPSWQLHRPRDAHYLDRWLAQGFAVVATDYQGLGGPGPHPYLFWEAEGRSVLDSARAALAFYPDRLSNQVVITGQSQGSGAALGASRIAHSYAPGLHVVASIATGVAPSFPADASSPPAWRLSEHVPPRFTMLRLLGGAIPDAGPPASRLVTDKGAALLSSASRQCIDALRGEEQAQGITNANAFTLPAAALQALLTPSTEMTPVQLPMPVFLGTGLADRTVPPAHQHRAATALCAAGTSLVWRGYAGITHNGIVNAAFEDERVFVRQALAGLPVAGNCGQTSAPGPAEKPAQDVLYND